MVKVLQDLYVISEGGIVLYHRVFDGKFDEQLFGGLMSALNSFAEELTHEGLSNFELQDKRYTFKRKNDILFVANSSKKIKGKRVNEELKSIINHFFDLYPKEILESWEGDVSIFLDFEKEIEDSLEGTIQKLQKAFW
ncbi:MAG: hypothetical protein ACTSP9_09885 [Promethearchaeota archaeon]